MSEAYSNKKPQIWTGVFGCLASACVLGLPIWVYEFQWDSAVTIAGSILSLTGIVVALMQIRGVKQSTDAINDAVAQNTLAISRIARVYDISRHTQMILEIHSYLKSGKWEMAHLRMVEINMIMTDISENRDLFKIEPKEINRLLSNIAEDLRSLNDAIHRSMEIEAVTIVNHLEEVSPFLNKVCNKIKKI